MIYTIHEYSEQFLLSGKRVCERTIIRRCETNSLPSGHIPHKKQVRKDGLWLIEVLSVDRTNTGVQYPKVNKVTAGDTK